MLRLVTVLLLSSFISFGKLTRVQAEGPSLETVAVEAIKFVGSYAGGKVLDKALGLDPAENINELNRQLAALEEVLSLLESKAESDIRSLRKELNEKTSQTAVQSRIRRAMSTLERELKSESETILRAVERNGQAVLDRMSAEVARIDARMLSIEGRQSAMENRQSDLETRQSTLETRHTGMQGRQRSLELRWEEYEKNFGAVPRTAPKPYQVLIGRDSDAQIASHPRMVDFMRLLIQSEQSRVRLDYLSSTYRPDAEIVVQARAEDARLSDLAMQLHQMIFDEVEAYRKQEAALLKTVSEAHFKVTDLRKRAASLLWLLAASKPVKHKGAMRLGVPKALADDTCSEILGAYVDSGGNPRDLRPLVELQLEQDVYVRQHQLAHARIGQIPKEYEPHIRSISSEFTRFVWQLQSTCLKAREIEARIVVARRAQATASRELIELRRRKSEIIASVKTLEERAKTLSLRVLNGYCTLLCSRKPSSEFMIQLKNRLVVPAMCCVRLTACESWESDTAMSEVWKRLVHNAALLSTIDLDSSWDDDLIGSHRFWSDSGYRPNKTGKVLISRDESFRFSYSQDRKSLLFHPAEGMERIKPKKFAYPPPPTPLFEKLEFDAKIRYFDGKSRNAVVMLEDGSTYLISNDQAKEWPKDRLLAEIPVNVPTAVMVDGKVVENPDYLKDLEKGRIVAYEGWGIKKSIRFGNPPVSLANVDDSTLVVLHRQSGQSFVSVYRWTGELVSSVPVPEGGEADAVVSDGKIVYVLSDYGRRTAAWDLSLLLRLES